MNIDNKKGRLESLGVVIEPLNINELKFIFPTINYEIIKEDNDVVKIVYDLESIEVGENYSCTITADKNKFEIDFKINNIIVSKNNPKVIRTSETQYNTATLFALPLLFNEKSVSSFITSNVGYLLNCYVDCDFIHSKDKYSVFLLLKFMKTKRYKIQEEYFFNHPTYVKSEDVNSKYVVYEFSIPEEFRKDYELIFQGKYSKISKKSRDRILAFHGNSTDGSIIAKVIDRSIDLIKYYQEVYDMPMDGIELYKKFDEKDILTKSIL